MTFKKAPDLPTVYPTVVHMLDAAVRQRPEHVALVCPGEPCSEQPCSEQQGNEQLTYREYAASVAALARELRQNGLGAGQRVGVLMGNSLDMAVALFAVQAAGAQVVPLNPAYTARELRPILDSAQARGVIYDAAAAPLIDAFLDRFHFRLAVGARPARRLLRGTGQPAPPDAPDLAADLAANLADFLPDPASASDIPATLQYTGGTTGVPKGVSLTHRAVSINVSQREALLPTRYGQERVLVMTPLFHVYAVSMGLHLAAWAASTLVILPRYRPEAVLQAIGQHRITLLCASPTILTGLMQCEGFEKADLSSLRVCFSGSAALAQETLQRWEAATGCRVCEGYGQTEAGPVLTYNPSAPRFGPRKPGTAGIALPRTDVQIVDLLTGTQVLDAGQTGEIRARGPQLMSGYLGLPQETAAALRDGWLYTGDVGWLDADGYLTICDRKKEMVIVSGFNVYPREIEEVLHSHPGVCEAAVIGVPHPYRGECLLAFVVVAAVATAVSDMANPCADVTVAALEKHVRQHLVKYKWPAQIRLLDQLPKTSVGKVDKKALRQRYGALDGA